MKILKITRRDGRVERSDFKTLEEAEAHFIKNKAYWGEDEKTISHPDQTIHHPEIVTPDQFDDLGKVVVAGSITPAWDEFIPAHTEVIPAEYVKEIIDTDPADAIEKTKRADRVTRIDTLKAVNWSTIDSIAKLRAILRVAVKEIIKDDE